MIGTLVGLSLAGVAGGGGLVGWRARRKKAAKRSGGLSSTPASSTNAVPLEGPRVVLGGAAAGGGAEVMNFMPAVVKEEGQALRAEVMPVTREAQKARAVLRSKTLEVPAVVRMEFETAVMPAGKKTKASDGPPIFTLDEM